jgi:hypothetical protein
VKEEDDKSVVGMDIVGEGKAVTKAKETVDEASARTTRLVKAVKSDNAKSPMYLWDERILLSMEVTEIPDKEKVTGALTTLRRLVLRYWKKKVHRNFCKWF